MITLFGVTFYTLWAATFLFAVTGLIYLAFVLRYFVKRYERQFGLKIVGRFLIVSFSGLTVLFTIFHWDIILTGIYVDKLCKEEGGLHVYETVKVDGFSGNYVTKEWLKYGYLFIEEQNFKKKYRYIMENGEIKKKKVDVFKSRYEIISESTYLFKFFNRSRLRRLRHVIEDKVTSRILGELVHFTINQGWADSFIAIGFNPWICCNISKINGKKTEFLSRTDLIKAVLIPNNPSRQGSK